MPNCRDLKNVFLSGMLSMRLNDLRLRLTKRSGPAYVRAEIERAGKGLLPPVKFANGPTFSPSEQFDGYFSWVSEQLKAAVEEAFQAAASLETADPTKADEGFEIADCVLVSVPGIRIQVEFGLSKSGPLTEAESKVFGDLINAFQRALEARLSYEASRPRAIDTDLEKPKRKRGWFRW